jgi:ADP-ribose pyrophosphatase YjhB (NUDIX family)
MFAVMSAAHIRVLALGVIRNGDRMLLEHGFDSVKQSRFFRPPGGGVEFSESTSAALRREFREELSAEIHEPRLLGVLENLFEYEGVPGHEIVFVFESRFVDASLNTRQTFVIEEDPNRPIEATWLSLEDVCSTGQPLYPTGLLELLQNVS